MNSRTAISLLDTTRDGANGISLVVGEGFITAGARSAPLRVKAGAVEASTRRASFNVQRLDGGVRIACVDRAVTCLRADWPILLLGNEQRFGRAAIMEGRSQTG